MKKINEPCFYFNMGNCVHPNGKPKSAEECKYEHVKIEKILDKPQHLKFPCKFFHLYAKCSNANCRYGHAELSLKRWRRFFPSLPFPGYSYSRACKWITTGGPEYVNTDLDIESVCRLVLEEAFNATVRAAVSRPITPNNNLQNNTYFALSNGAFT